MSWPARSSWQDWDGKVDWEDWEGGSTPPPAIPGERVNGRVVLGPELPPEWHTYTVEKTPEGVRSWIDGVEVAESEGPQ